MSGSFRLKPLLIALVIPQAAGLAGSLLAGDMSACLLYTSKADKLSKTQRAVRLAALETELPCADQIVTIPFSSETGEGVDAVKDVVAQIERDCMEQPPAE